MDRDQPECAQRAWAIPRATRCLPGENAVPFAQPDSWVRKRAAFLNSHVWVTPYQRGEMYAGGDYPNQSRGGDGLPRWAAANRTHPQSGRGAVVQHGDHAQSASGGLARDAAYTPPAFKLVPWGFFGRNPAMDLPAVVHFASA